MERWFEDHAVWITGGSSGIGRATARVFALQGAKVAVSGRRSDRLEEVVAELEGLGAEAFAVPCDVRDDEQIEAAVLEVVDRFGKLDVALANAGFSVAGRIADLSGEDWRRQLETNVVGSALSARFSIPHLEQTRGRMGFIGSVASFICAPKLGAYSASKFAVRALGQTLSIELEGRGVSSTLIHPGYVDTEIAQVDNSGRYDPSREDRRPKNLMWPADKAAEVVVKALFKRKREVVFSGHGKVGAFLGQHLPGIARRVVARAMG
jgi:NAD(P)-dependent dehydrogenase (short-subunit alcohol dehydrogenase family)